jgi:hypothetical protein
MDSSFKQALVEKAKVVELGTEHCPYPVRLTPKRRLRQVDLSP